MKVAHTVYAYITEESFNEISKYNADDITFEKFKDPRRLEELKDILIYHPNQIIRHEAAFIIGELANKGLPVLIEYLIPVIKFDKSIVAKHEAVEALGRVNHPNDIVNAYRFLCRLTTRKFYEDEVYHPDVQQTAKEAKSRLEKKLKKLSKWQQKIVGYRK